MGSKVRRLVVPLALAAAVVASAAPASAAEWGKLGSGGGSAIADGRNFGLGGYIGSEVGLGIKWFFSKPHALDVGLGFGSWWGSWFRLHADYLYHFLVHRGRIAEVLLYPGVGAGFDYTRDHWGYWRDDWLDRCGPYDHCAAGFLRGVFGVNWLIQAHHFDVFAEIAVDFEFSAYGLWPWFEFLGGLRYYF